mmetsp:Transcript_10067/g.15248  ORF Transcript_10067/g.15248 Transcript_10067/m.15248 type:complete len:594 (+) Transcript_10067:70-1851(+)
MSNLSVHLCVTKDVDEVHQAKWLEMAKELCEKSRQEDGCIFYTFVKNPSVSTRFVIIEEWASQSHLEAHSKTEHFTRLVPLMDAISSTPCLDICNEVDFNMPSKGHPGRILVLFDSSTYCTERMAEFIAEGVRQVGLFDVRIRVVPGPFNTWDANQEQRSSHPEATFEDVLWADGIACGTPTNLGGISWRMKKFWDDFSQAGHFGRIDGKVACSFSSQGGAAGGAELANMSMNHVLMNFGMSIIGITDYVGFKSTLHYGAACAKAPRDDYDQLACRRLGIRLAEFVGLYLLGFKELHPLRATKAWDHERWGYPGIPSKTATLEDVKEHEAACQQRRNLTSAVLSRRSPYVPPITQPTRRALIFTKMCDFVHHSTPAAASWVHQTCTSLGLQAVVSGDSSLLETPSTTFDLIILVNNSGEIFDVSKETLTAHVEAGRGVVGVHAALACFLDGKDASGATKLGSTTNVIESVFGAHFRNHPPVQSGQVTVHSSRDTLGGLPTIPDTFTHTDEFFNFSRNPADDKDLTVIASVDETTYEGGLMGAKHPVVWHRRVGANKAPVFYSALGHFDHFYNGLGPNYVTEFLKAGIEYCLAN